MRRTRPPITCHGRAPEGAGARHAPMYARVGQTAVSSRSLGAPSNLISSRRAQTEERLLLGPPHLQVVWWDQRPHLA